ncbi:hypothetical protein [Nonomuraea sp. NPDC049400]|uniref:hypothetical protein n=1 Tax=Nonomuraea sp. NPDC049400 TaxID=3364352 RepID=UPI0037AB2D62
MAKLPRTLNLSSLYGLHEVVEFDEQRLEEDGLRCGPRLAVPLSCAGPDSSPGQRGIPERKEKVDPVGHRG